MGEFEGITAAFEACTEFRGNDDDILVCSCGWLEHDHGADTLPIGTMPTETMPTETIAVVTPVRRRHPQITLPERRAS